MKRELELSQKRMANARLLMLDGSLGADNYRSAKSLLDPEIEKLQRQIAQWEETDPEEGKILEYGSFFLPYMNVLFDLASPEEKYQFLSSTFPEKFVFKDGKCRTNSENPIIQALFSDDAGFREIKNGSTTSFVLPSGRVGVDGLEPPTLCL